jgi:hypothetical protein
MIRNLMVMPKSNSKLKIIKIGQGKIGSEVKNIIILTKNKDL